ncbi:site-specific tyrosine recombinase XerD [Aestuariimicrobium sp. p3-SID1156]|uniref:site-specific tyrosine recombinase XerD n=1 Tax=Aestuariimicrobium sp. p3-SID1156 TaxID=2916038 RepID=UPI00223B5722|nr:site-specific tyrosine recombinase XerD [Aestuariimicrobium sp. p3-SID1156]MCT1459154.1 site-specific tyrosine recombinase XerD [Aestuariimicrobium sp. p3-SID1156]
MPDAPATEPTPVPRELATVLQDYLDHLTVERGLSANTLESYRRDLERYLRHLTERGVIALREVAPSDVDEFSQWLSAGAGTGTPMARSSVGRAVVAVRGFHKFVAGEGITAADPAVEVTPPAVGKRLPKALSQDQVAALLATPDTTTVDGLRDAVLLELLYGTGARISEVCGLDVDDVSRALDDEDAAIRLLGKGNKERVVPLGSFARAAVDQWLVRGRPGWATRARQPGPALLLNTRGNRLSRQSAWAIVQTAAEKARLGVEVSPHSLRHSFATHLLDGGADIRVVQELLGHSSVTTTQIYTMVTVEHLREVYRSSHPRARS